MRLLLSLLMGMLFLLLPPLSQAAEETFPSIVAKVQKGTVMIEARNRSETHFGTGFFLDSPQVVITALHVIEGAERIRIAIPNTFHTSDALLVSASPKWDLALLQVSWPEEVEAPGLKLAPVKGLLPVGTEVAYTGYGFGADPSLINVLSTFQGIVSSHVPQKKGGHLYLLSGQVNRGLSGSALYLPGSGKVVGVVTRHFGPPDSAQGLGGAVPGSVLRKFVEDLQR